jgi:peroxiredoxin Q/BCP
MMTEYGAYGEKMNYGKTIMGIIRSTVWIDPAGIVKKHWARVPNAEEHPSKVLAALKTGIKG